MWVQGLDAGMGAGVSIGVDVCVGTRFGCSYEYMFGSMCGCSVWIQV